MADAAITIQDVDPVSEKFIGMFNQVGTKGHAVLVKGILGDDFSPGQELPGLDPIEDRVGHKAVEDSGQDRPHHDGHDQEQENPAD